MASESLTQLEAQLRDRVRSHQLVIPSYPAIATKLQAMVAAGRSVEQLAAVTANDPPLVATLIAQASTARFGVSDQLGIVAAIKRVGVDELVQIAITQSVGAIALAPGPLEVLRRDTWRRALVSGRVAEVLAARRKISAPDSYLAGLLHDFGATAALAAIETLSKTTPLPAATESAWRELVARVSALFGEAISSHWKLPPAIAEVITGRGDSPLARFLALVQRSVALLDDDMLDTSTELSEVEREAILGCLPEIISQMALYTHTVSKYSPPTTGARVAEAWPVAFGVVHRSAAYAARSISSDGIEMVGKLQLATHWPVNVTVQCEPEPIDMLLTVKQCDARPDGTCVIVAKPFGLPRAAKLRWQALLDSARR